MSPSSLPLAVAFSHADPPYLPYVGRCSPPLSKSTGHSSPSASNVGFRADRLGRGRSGRGREEPDGLLGSRQSAQFNSVNLADRPQLALSTLSCQTRAAGIGHYVSVQGSSIGVHIAFLPCLVDHPVSVQSDTA